MTITRTIGAFHDSSNARIRKIGEMAGPTSYAAGGDPLVAKDLGMGNIELLLLEEFWNGTAIATGRYNYSTGKLQLFGPTGTELTGNLSAYVARFEAIGK